MREIKFRGKCSQSKRWVYGWLLTNKLGTYIVTEENPHEYTQNHYIEIDEYCRVVPATVGQYTGLTDKNGTEIYEGDIMGGPIQLVTIRGNPTGDYTETRFVVEWDEKRTKFTARQTHDSRYPDFYATRKASTELTIIADYYPVIGNIHDNPELLGGAE
ncbi:MAG: YopX family protein [Eubacteriales bacterium]|nr:YopX family protein [Eubacteriales bacterium]